MYETKKCSDKMYSCKPINLKSCIMWYRDVASLSLSLLLAPFSPRWCFAFVLTPLYCWFDLLDPVTGTSVVSTTSHRHTQLWSCASHVTPCFLSWGEECECAMVTVAVVPWAWGFPGDSVIPRISVLYLLPVFSFSLLSNPLSTPSYIWL